LRAQRRVQFALLLQEPGLGVSIREPPGTIRLGVGLGDHPIDGSRGAGEYRVMSLIETHARILQMGANVFRTADVAAYLALSNSTASQMLARLAKVGHIL